METSRPILDVETQVHHLRSFGIAGYVSYISEAHSRIGGLRIPNSREQVDETPPDPRIEGEREMIGNGSWFPQLFVGEGRSYRMVSRIKANNWMPQP